MKKVIILLAFIFAANVGFSQSMFDKLEYLDEVSSVVVTKDAFELIKKFPDAQSEDMEIINTAKSLEELKVFSTEDMKIATQMDEMVNKAIKSSNLTQLMRVKDKGSRVKIYIKSTSNKDIVSEVLMYVKSSDKEDKDDKPSATIISLTGEIDVNKLAKIAGNYEKKSNK